MGKVVLGVGTSHGPLLSCPPEQWPDHAASDFRKSQLNLSDGRFLTYDELAAEVGERYGDVATVENYRAKSAACQQALDRIAADIADTAPDIAIIIGDDHCELFSLANMPAISLYYGDKLVTKKWKITEETPDYRKVVVKGYAMDDANVFAAAPDLARDLIRRVTAKGFDLGAAASVEDPETAGFGHAFGFVIRRLFDGRSIPVVPVLLNTYYPPNVPSAARCFDFGAAMREAIEERDDDLKVAVIGSGGLSHFVVDEALDHEVLEAMSGGDWEALRALPAEALNSGSSEILCWIAAAGAMTGLTGRWTEYQPIYRTPAGTGIGFGFGGWS